MAWEADEETFGPGGGWVINDAGERVADPYGSQSPDAGAPSPVEAMPGPSAANPLAVMPGPKAQLRAAMTGGDKQTGSDLDAATQAYVQQMNDLSDAPQTVVKSIVDSMPGPGNTGTATENRGGATIPKLPEAKRGAVGDQVLGVQSIGGGTETTNEHDSSSSTKGYSAKDRERLEQGYTGAEGAEGEAFAAEQARQRGEEAKQSAQQQELDEQIRKERLANALEMKRVQSEKAETERRLSDTADFKPDRGRLFHSAGFTISAAISAMAGGWLMGQGLTGGKNPYLDNILGMVNDDANDQVRTNSAVYQELSRRLGSTEAARHELKERMLLNAKADMDNRAAKAATQTAIAGHAAAQKAFDAQIARAHIEKIKALTPEVTQSQSQRSSNVTKSGPLQVMFGAIKAGEESPQTLLLAAQQYDRNPEKATAEGMKLPDYSSKMGDISDQKRLTQKLRDYAENGTLQKVSGFFGEMKPTRLLDKNEQEALRTLNTLRVQMLMSLPREPNSQKTQDEVANILKPTTPEDIPNVIQYLEQTNAARERNINNATSIGVRGRYAVSSGLVDAQGNVGGLPPMRRVDTTRPVPDKEPR